MGASDRRIAVGWRLVGLAALAIGAGACSEPRSLVQLDVAVDTSQQALDVSHARLHIDITEGGKPIRDAGGDRPMSELQSEDSEGNKFQIGVFLPPSVSGMIQVVVIVLDQNDCKVGQSLTNPNVVVSAGKIARPKEQIVVIILPEPICPGDAGAPPATPDAGPEAEPPAPDAGQTDSADGSDETTPPAPDAATLDTGCAPDAGVEVAPPPTCEEFCSMAPAKCPTYYDNVNCMSICSLWAPGAVSDKAGMPLDGDTIGCRLYFLQHWQSVLSEIDCAAAAPKSSVCSN